MGGTRGTSFGRVWLKIFINGLEKQEDRAGVKSVQVASNYLGFYLLTEEGKKLVNGRKKYEGLQEAPERFDQTGRWSSKRDKCKTDQP